MELNYPRFIHSEVMTHRMFSRNASSSRAIPIEKIIRQVVTNPAMPIHWGKNQPGMQAREELDSICGIGYWQKAADCVTDIACDMMNDGYHKQIVNRLLEPFQWIKVIVTATEWDNFFNLRLHPDAQPEIQELARCMWGEISNSVPAALDLGEWHMPYLTSEEWYGFNIGSLTQGDLIKCSVARCARVSYQNHDMTVPDIEKDIALADRLLAAGHMSPFEHIATPMLRKVDLNCNPLHWEKGVTHMDRSQRLWSGNFRGFIQYRQLVNN